MKTIKLLVCVLFFLASSLVLADDNKVQIKVGGKKIEIPIPEGFQDAAVSHPLSIEVVEKLFPPVYRVLAVLISENDLVRLVNDQDPKYDRLMVILVIRDLEGRNITKNLYRQLIVETKNQLGNVAQNSEEFWGEHLNEIINQSNGSDNIEMGKPVILGTILDKPNAWGVASMAKLTGNVNNEAINSIHVQGGATIYSKRRIIIANIYSKFEDTDDISWVKTATKEWTDSILSEN